MPLWVFLRVQLLAWLRLHDLTVGAHAAQCREVVQTKNMGMNMQQSSVQVRYYTSDLLHTEERECLPFDDTPECSCWTALAF